ncbi:hypothetical protein LguiA_009239 [Lonicera macranthoides]
MEGRENTTNEPAYVYKECVRNHAASLGGYATDGCGEFTPVHSSPASLHCAACSCHRNFHRKLTNTGATGPVAAYLVDCGGGGEGRQVVVASDRIGKKRSRTKFTAEQKEKMMEFAKKLGWKLQRRDVGDEVERFCRGVGVSRQVFKVWMHNHKYSSASYASNGNAASSES